MAFANRHTDSLARLLLSSILHVQVLIGRRPSFSLEVSGLENALIEKDKMSSTLNDIVQPLVESYSLILKLLNPLLFLSWDVTDFDLLQPQSCLLHHLQHYTSLNPSASKLAVKQNTSVIDI